MHDISSRQAQIIEDFSIFDNWMHKYEYIIEIGKALPSLDEEHRKSVNLVHGCQSQVWLVSSLKDNRIFFHADSDAIITRGLIALLIQVLSGAKPIEIINAEIYFLEAIGLHSHLSPNRSNGLANMLNRMLQIANSSI